MRKLLFSAALVGITVLPARAGPRILVDAPLPQRLPAPPTQKLAPALIATIQVGVGGRFVGFTRPQGKAVIELPNGADVGGAIATLSDPTHFPHVTSASNEPVDEISELIVLYRPGFQLASLPPVIAGYPVKERYQPGSFVVLDGSSGITTPRLQVLRADPEIRFVEPNYRYRLTAASPPNDPDWVNDDSGLWGMRLIGAADAWKTVHDSSVRVAVIDTGIDLTHRDLQGNLWRNAMESSGSSDIDDDVPPNGCVDDIHGCDFLEDDPPDDAHGHGTQVSGIIGSVGNNGMGTVGVVWHIPLIAVRIFESNFADTDDAVKAIDYSVASGAKIINASWSGRNSQSVVLSQAITRADTAKVLLVASTGNGRSNLDDPVEAEYPAAYAHQNIVAVLATDDLDQNAFATGVGAMSVDLGAPGSDIQTTTLGDKYGKQAGTSFAVPHVVGALALVWAAEPTLDYLVVRQRVLDNVAPQTALSGKCVTGGRLNLRFLGPKAPPAPTLREVTPQ